MLKKQNYYNKIRYIVQMSEIKKEPTNLLVLESYYLLRHSVPTQQSHLP